jgi:hypothetical protein
MTGAIKNYEKERRRGRKSSRSLKKTTTGRRENNAILHRTIAGYKRNRTAVG